MLCRYWDAVEVGLPTFLMEHTTPISTPPLPLHFDCHIPLAESTTRSFDTPHQSFSEEGQMAPRSGHVLLSVRWIRVPPLVHWFSSSICPSALLLLVSVAYCSIWCVHVLAQTDLLENFCSGRGIINSNLTCSCFSGFRGPDCSLRE